MKQLMDNYQNTCFVLKSRRKKILKNKKVELQNVIMENGDYVVVPESVAEIERWRSKVNPVCFYPFLGLEERDFCCIVQGSVNSKVILSVSKTNSFCLLLFVFFFT